VDGVGFEFLEVSFVEKRHKKGVTILFDYTVMFKYPLKMSFLYTNL